MDTLSFFMYINLKKINIILSEIAIPISSKMCFICSVPQTGYVFVCLYVCLRRRKEGNVLFNDTLNTFYLRLYGVRHRVNRGPHIIQCYVIVLCAHIT